MCLHSQHHTDYTFQVELRAPPEPTEAIAGAAERSCKGIQEETTTGVWWVPPSNLAPKVQLWGCAVTAASQNSEMPAGGFSVLISQQTARPTPLVPVLERSSHCLHGQAANLPDLSALVPFNYKFYL